MTASPDGPASPPGPEAETRRLDLAVQDPANRKASAVKVAAALGVDVGRIQGRRDDSVLIRYRWPDGTRLGKPARLRELFGGRPSPGPG